MIRYFIRFSYLGTLYRGSAKQTKRDSIRDIDTIQGVLESAFLSLVPLPKAVHTRLGSRTDKGVHAFDAVGIVKIKTKNDIWYNREFILQQINRFMIVTNNSIRLLECIPVSSDLKLGSIIKSRTYIYRFMVPKEQEDLRIPIIEQQHTFVIRYKTFDIARMEQAMQLFIGRKNFMSFAAVKKTCEPIQFERTLNELSLEKASSLSPFDPLSANYNYWHIICNAKSFLYNQVRRMSGTLFALAAGRITEKDIHIMLTVPSHANWNVHITPSSPQGLYLTKTECDEDLLKTHVLKDVAGEDPLKEENTEPSVTSSCDQ